MRKNICLGVFKDYYPWMLNYILVFEMPWVLNGKSLSLFFKLGFRIRQIMEIYFLLLLPSFVISIIM